MRLEFEEGRPVEIVSPADTPPDPESIRRSIAQPIDSKDFSSFISGKKKILVVVNDHNVVDADCGGFEVPRIEEGGYNNYCDRITQSSGSKGA